MIKFNPGDIYGEEDQTILEMSLKEGNPKLWKQQILSNQEKAEKWDGRGDIFKSMELTDEQSKKFSDDIHKSHIKVVGEIMEEDDILRQGNKQLKEIVDHIQNCHNCASFGWSNCKFYRQHLDNWTTSEGKS